MRQGKTTTTKRGAGIHSNEMAKNKRKKSVKTKTNTRRNLPLVAGADTRWK